LRVLCACSLVFSVVFECGEDVLDFVDLGGAEFVGDLDPVGADTGEGEWRGPRCAADCDRHAHHAALGFT